MSSEKLVEFPICNRNWSKLGETGRVLDLGLVILANRVNVLQYNFKLVLFHFLHILFFCVLLIVATDFVKRCN